MAKFYIFIILNLIYSQADTTSVKFDPQTGKLQAAGFRRSASETDDVVYNRLLRDQEARAMTFQLLRRGRWWIMIPYKRFKCLICQTLWQIK